jgi:hypothetical protein
MLPILNPFFKVRSRAVFAGANAVLLMRILDSLEDRLLAASRQATARTD